MTFVSDAGTNALPFPGGDLAFRVAGTADREWFFKSGRQSAEDIANGLAVVGSRPQAYERILDFGCGCGRVLLWLKDLAGTTALHGTDIDSTAIDWARAHLPYARFTVNNPLPPTGFPDAFFDFVYCHSVFTHIDETYQDAWLGELQRIVKPGGRLLLSVNGEYAFQQLENVRSAQGLHSGALRTSRDMKGILFVTEDQWIGGPFPDFYHTTFHTPEYVFAHWSRYFRIRAYIPQGSLAHQDYVLLERTAPGELHNAPPVRSTPGEAIYQVVTLLTQGPNLERPGRFGRLSVRARKVVKRLLRHHSNHELEVHSGIVDSLRAVERQHRELEQQIRQQDDRISQLEKQREG
jgi:SAM-dependent methyltransferase